MLRQRFEVRSQMSVFHGQIKYFEAVTHDFSSTTSVTRLSYSQNRCNDNCSSSAEKWTCEPKPGPGQNDFFIWPLQSHLDSCALRNTPDTATPIAVLSSVHVTQFNMHLLLSNLPRDVLKDLLFFLPDAETISRLYGCGNRHLMKKITSGAVTYLKLKPYEPLGRTFLFVSTLCLDSISVGPGAASDALLRVLIRALPSTLRSLELTYLEPASFWLCDPSDGLPAATPLGGPLAQLDTQLKSVWTVKDTFPCLERLALCSAGSFELDIISIVRILCGLPSTLVALYLDFLNTCELDFYPLLPWRLECLGSNSGLSNLFSVPDIHFQVIPSHHLTEHHLRCLSSLQLSLEYPFYTVHLGAQWHPKAETELWLPPTLVSLSLQYQLYQTPLLSALSTGSGLETLTLQILAHEEQVMAKKFFDALRFVPPSVTSLQLIGYCLKDDDSLNPPAHVRTSPSLKRFRLHRSSPTAAHLLHLATALSESPIEIFVMAETMSILTLEMVKLLGPRLRTLEAPFAEECFPSGDGPYPLHEQLRGLHTLHMGSPEMHPPAVDFNFAAIPPSVTRFDSDCHYSTKSLHLMPPNVTKFSMSRLEVSTEGKYYDYLSQGYAQQGPVLRLAFPNTGVIYRIGCISNEPSCTVRLTWPKQLLPPPNTVTDLTIYHSSLDDSFTPQNLPHLTRLKLIDNEAHRETKCAVGGFSSLLELTGHVDYCDTCPPNLTTLDCQYELPSWFEELPSSLTSLKCSGFEPSQVQSLTALQSFTILHPNTTIDMLLHLTPSLKSLAFPLRTVARSRQSEWKTLFDHFCALESLLLPGSGRGRESETYQALLATKPSHITIIGPKTLTKGPSFESLVSHQAKYQPLVEIESLSKFLDKDAKWPILTSVTCNWMDPLDDRSDSIQPPFNPLERFYFPTTITTLKIYSCGGHQNLVGSLPSGLTHLEIPNWSIDYLVPTWPPALTYLEVYFDAALEANLGALPSRLTHLELCNIKLPSQLFPAIPPQVERLCVSLNEYDFPEMLDYAKERGHLVWVIPRDSDTLAYLSYNLDIGSGIDEMARKMRHDAEQELAAIEGGQCLDRTRHGAAQTNSLLSSSPELQVPCGDPIDDDVESRLRTKRPRPYLAVSHADGLKKACLKAEE